MKTVRIAPSILSADFSRLGDEIRAAESGGADWIHLDVMDGHFVPNLTFGPVVVAAARRVTGLPLDIHLMIEEPDRYVDPLVEAGANTLTVQWEVCRHLHRTVQQIHRAGARAGVAINPATPVELLREIAPFLDQVLIMSVNPGFGGQEFIPTSTAKIARARDLLERLGRTDVDLQVDGGIDPSTAPVVVAAGADVLVAGSAVYKGDGTVAENIAALRRAAGGGPPSP